jgi:uncharacterized cysteine cluster protein YcgN (CxxCxxCC family)
MFWEAKRLEDLTPAQWEALCDRCGCCCLEKLTDPKTGKVFYTSVPCRLLDVQRGTCRAYDHRTLRVPTCLQLTPSLIHDCRWLPQSCAYRRLAEGRPLPDWHPLLSGEAVSVQRAGIAVRHFPLTTVLPKDYDLTDFIVDWGIWGRWRRRKNTRQG